MNNRLIVIVLLFLCLASTSHAKSLIPKLKKAPDVGSAFTEKSLWCSKKTKTSQSKCYCFEPLGNAAATSSFKQEVDEIKALAVGTLKSVSLNCRFAEAGTCGELQYIYCDNGERGSMLRLFSSDKLIAARSRSDYGEFCDGQAMERIVGLIPPCKPMKQTAVLHGKGTTPRALSEMF